jgi:hypothetical protein
MARTTMSRPTDHDVVVVDANKAGPSRIRWSAVFAGMVLTVAMLVLLSSLWLALAYGSDSAFIARNLEWFFGGSAVGCFLVGGFVAGRVSGIRGAGPGLSHGLTLWAVSLIVVLAVGIPSVINVLNLGRVTTQLSDSGVIATGVDTSLWATFIAIGGALVTAGLGGMIGGASVRASRSSDTDSMFT